MNGTSIAFAGNNLQTSTVMVSAIDVENSADRDAKVYTIAHGNGNRIPYIGYPQKVIPISGTIQCSSIQALDAQLDIFRSWFVPQDANLDIGYAGSTRRYVGTATKVAISRPNGLAYAKFNISFTCQPFGQDVNTTTAISATGRTAGSYTDNFTFTGTAPYQQPVITILYTAVSSTGPQPVTIGNNTNSQTITVNRTWSAGDTITIDTTKKTVTVNGTPFDFTGAFPEFSPGAGYIGYSDGFTTRTFNYSVVYYARYM